MAEKNQPNAPEDKKQKEETKSKLGSFASLFKKKEESAGSGNIFTEVKEEGEKKQDTSAIIDSIVSQTEKDKSILGAKPSKPKFPIKERPPFGYQIARFGFQIVILIALFGFSFLYYQLDADSAYFRWLLGDNLASEFDQSNKEIIDLQTQVNANRYLVMKLKLDHFLLLAESYLYYNNQINSKIIDDASKLKFETEVKEKGDEIKSVLLTVKENLNQPIHLSLPGKTDAEAEMEFNSALQEYIREEKSGLRKKLDQEELKKEVFEELKNYDAVLALLSDTKIKAALADLNPETDLTKDKIEELQEIVNDVNKNEFSVISKVKSASIRWSEQIDHIEKITKKIDPLFRHAALQDSGEISYKSYSFDTNSKKIQITGETRREDNRNFTLLANLIDAFEKSFKFKDVDARTFSKSEKEDKSIAPISLSMVIQEETIEEEELEEEEKTKEAE